MTPLARTFLIAGVVFFAIGLLLHFGPSVPLLGKLPGDIRIERPGLTAVHGHPEHPLEGHVPYMGTNPSELARCFAAFPEGLLLTGFPSVGYVLVPDGEPYSHVGRFDYLDPTVEKSTDTVLARASFPNPDSLLIPGEFVRVQVQLKESVKALAISQAAVQEVVLAAELHGLHVFRLVGELARIVGPDGKASIDAITARFQVDW